MGAYITHDNVAARLTWEKVHEVFDDEQDGDWQTPLAEFIDDAESVIEQSIVKTYGDAGLTWLRAQGQGCPRAVKRLCLDELEWRMGMRHPGYTNAMHWADRRTQLNAQLKELRLRDVQLDTVGVGEPEPAVNEGGFVESGNPDDTTPVAKVFADGMGDFWGTS